VVLIGASLGALLVVTVGAGVLLARAIEAVAQAVLS
jgi:hypothetical protein